MLFNSYEFIFLFCPVTIFIFFLIGSKGYSSSAIVWLVCASLFFYGWWNPAYLLLITGSMVFNYGTGKVLGKQENSGLKNRIMLTFGISMNLALIGYYKYANFFVDNLNAVSGSSFHLEPIILPLAISFFTFQQIAYLVDAYKGLTREYRFFHYALFVTFFPQLIAGPIVHHQEVLPQFAEKKIFRPNYEHLAVGLTIFFFGLFKKAVLADGIAVYASPVFKNAQAGEILTFFEAWGGALSYTFQLYFDFSGYSDMAVGLGRIFGICLPMNFNSPYKSENITEFWRRWHITLSRFLKNYLYIPLGGNRKGMFMRYVNLMITMLLGGLWHGAGWPFVLWGGLHGFYLVIHHFWMEFQRKYHQTKSESIFSRFMSRFVTFVAVVAAWVFFRAESYGAAVNMLRGMFGCNGISLPAAVGYALGPVRGILEHLGITFGLGGGTVFAATYIWIVCLFFIVFFMPNTQEILRKFKPVYNFRISSEMEKIKILCWEPSVKWAFFSGMIAAVSILALTQVSEFLYFQF